MSSNILKTVVIAILSALAFPADVCAQEKVKFEWGGEFAAIFDNREGSANITPAQTYFLTQVAPEIGLSFCNREHRIMGGVVYTQPLGTDWAGYQLAPTVYYRYESHRHWSGSMGMFPRTQLIRQLPEYLESDSLRYFRHNILGALLQYQSDDGFFEAFIDWRGMQSHTKREAFAIVAQGQWRHNLLYAGGDAMMNHLAKAKGHPEQYVIDNQIYSAHFGVDFLPLLDPELKFNKLEISIGPIGALSRDRGIGKWQGSIGGRVDINMNWWRLGLRNALTISDEPLFSLFGSYGCQLHEGEPYFSKKLYNRTELSGMILGYKDILKLQAELDLHLTPGDWMFYQRLILTVRI